MKQLINLPTLSCSLYIKFSERVAKLSLLMHVIKDILKKFQLAVAKY